LLTPNPDDSEVYEYGILQTITPNKEKKKLKTGPAHQRNNILEVKRLRSGDFVIESCSKRERASRETKNPSPSAAAI